MIRLRLSIALVAVLAAAVFALPFAAPGAPVSAQEPVTVRMIDNVFSPASLTVSAGTTVIWVNDDFASGEYHDVISEDGAVFTDPFAPGDYTSYTFSTPGVYGYYCDLHLGMFGTITVR